MSEVLLEALMQLFALLTDVKHTLSSTGREKVSEYLSVQFNADYSTSSTAKASTPTKASKNAR